MKKAKTWSTMTLAMIPICIAINFVGAQISNALKLPMYLDVIGTIMMGAICGPIPGMVEVLRELALHAYRLVFFSDTSECHIMKLYHDADFAHLVSGAVFSYEVGARKPAAAMYEAFEERYGKPCFYLDDKPENVEAGRRHGWESHLFTSPAEFLRAFRAKYPHHH